MGFLQEINPFSNVKSAVKKASRETGVDFDYLMKTAERESSLNPKARARTSSATGLFQFIEPTWLTTMKEDGPALGLGNLASEISQTRDGRFVVPDKEARKKILGLRTDPTVSAMMAGAFTKKNHDALERGLGRQPTEGELYMAHFMGGKGALRFIQVATNKPGATAADYFPREAKANKSIFYASNGSPRTVAQVYKILSAKHDAEPLEMAAGRVRETTELALAAQENVSSYLPQEPKEPQPFSANHDASGPVFHGMFGSRSLMSDAANSRDFVSLWGSARQLATLEKPASSSLQEVVKDAEAKSAQQQVEITPPPIATQAGQRVVTAALDKAPIPGKRPYFPAETALVSGAENMQRQGATAAQNLGAISRQQAAMTEEQRLGAIGAPIDLAALTPGAWLRKDGEDKA